MTKQQHSFLKFTWLKKKNLPSLKKKKKLVLRLKNGKGAGRLLKELKSIPNCFLILEMEVMRMDRRGRLEKQDIVEVKDSQGTPLGPWWLTAPWCKSGSMLKEQVLSLKPEKGTWGWELWKWWIYFRKFWVPGNRETSNWNCPLGSLLYRLSEQKEDMSASQERDIYWQPAMCQKLLGVM